MSIRHALYPYQTEPARAIMDSVLHRKGLSFSLEISRQGGKNELSAQLEVLLLTLYMAYGGDAVKCSPTFKPQTINSMHRFKERLNDAGYGGFWRSEHGYIIRLGKARQLFFSADKDANVVGHTAHLLLEADEAQDIDKDKFSRDFRPMASTTNATTVFYGTAWDDCSLLEEMKQLHLEMERKDGIRRHFEYDWQEVARYNPSYLDYVEGERGRLGESHPLFQTQYCLKPLGQGGRLLSTTQLAQLQGDHPRQPGPSGEGSREGAVYVAGIDVAGEDEEPDPSRSEGRRDSTVMTIARLDFSASPVHGGLQGVRLPGAPQLRIVDHYVRTGIKHATLYPQLLDLLKNVWKCKRVVVDATGVGGGVAQFLLAALGEKTVTPYMFTAQSKSKLAFGFLEAINAGRLKMYAPPAGVLPWKGEPPYQQFWHQMEKARSSVRANQTMNFYVDPAEGHDDYLISTALAVEAAAAYRPRGARGRTRE